MNFLMLGAGCTPPNSPVLTDKGIKEIKDIEVGDRVWSYNIKSDCREYKRVIKLHDIYVPNNENIEVVTKHGSIIVSQTGRGNIFSLKKSKLEMCSINSSYKMER